MYSTTYAIECIMFARGDAVVSRCGGTEPEHCCFSFLSTSADAGVLIRQLRTDSFVIKLLQHCLVQCMKIYWNVEVMRLTVTLNHLQTSHCGELAAFVSVDEQDCSTTLLLAANLSRVPASLAAHSG